MYKKQFNVHRLSFCIFSDHEHLKRLFCQLSHHQGTLLHASSADFKSVFEENYANHKADEHRSKSVKSLTNVYFLISTFKVLNLENNFFVVHKELPGL